MTVEQFFNYFTASNTMELLLALMVLIIIITLIQMTRNPN
jgi:hypothetical protein